MTLSRIPWPSDSLNFSQSIVLNDDIFNIQAQWVEDEITQGSCWVMSITASDGTPIESGIRLVAGVRFAWRRVTGNEPLGALALSTLGGNTIPELPSIEDLQSGEVALFYDDEII
jgi:hypothetical protein